MEDKLTREEYYKINGSLLMADKICETVDNYYKERFDVELSDEDKMNFFPAILSMILPITLDDIDSEMKPKEFYHYLNEVIDKYNNSEASELLIGIRYSENIEEEEDIKS